MQFERKKRIAVLTSGGDAPGMNAAIRAVVRNSIWHGAEVIGVLRGYDGLLAGDFIPLDHKSVGGIILYGGTLLQTARCDKFLTPEGVKQGYDRLKAFGVDALVVIGGDGSFHGAEKLAALGMQVIGVPATIDKDMGGTFTTIGFDTACNTARECVRKLRDTASSHDRMFIVEVMGRNAGFLALETAVACGAEYVLVPEIETDFVELCERLRSSKSGGKNHAIVILAEGVMSASQLAEKLRTMDCGYDPKITVLGHLQRGGSPTSYDVVLATRLADIAVEAIYRGETNVMTGLMHNEIITCPISYAWEKKAPLDMELFNMIEKLSK